MFRRRKRQDEADQLEELQADEVDGAEEGAQDEAPAAPTRPQGPWDLADAPEDGLARLDLGSLRVPVPPDSEVRVDVNAEGTIIAATIARGGGQVQVNAFAAPRTEGIWDEVRTEIQEALTASGGKAEPREVNGRTELHALVPTEVPGRGVALAPARFVGIDGPRWFLRALFTGAAATQGEVAAPLEAAVRAIVVVRGTDPMAVRDPLPLTLPPEAQAAAAAEGTEVAPQEVAADGAAIADAAPVETEPRAASEGEAESQGQTEQPRLQMPERGPEITETR